MQPKRIPEEPVPGGATAPRLQRSTRSAVAIACLAAAAFARADPAASTGEQADTAATGQKVAAARPEPGEEITVTGTREPRRLRETPLSVGVVGSAALHLTRPTHPQQVLSQVPGAAVAITNGEGHTTAIRQPFSTSPVYLFLEDGIPVRATGFFNHNALYELNVPSAGRMEVVRGPGTALYGSDAVAGVVNVVTARSAPDARASISTEGGSSGWLRLLASGSTGERDWGGARADLNISHSDGWRDRTAYDRQSGTARWDLAAGDAFSVKAVLSATRVDQETGASAPLPRALYESAPTTNLHGIAFRKVDALRLSFEVERHGETDLVALTPYFRRNSMVLNGSYNLSSDPRIETSENLSFGMLAKWRHDFEPWRSQLVAGLDLDFSPGSRSEDNILVTRTGTGASTRYTGYTLGTRIYDYGVSFHSVSPYLHAEASPLERVRVTAGLRFDTLGYRMSNDLPDGAVQATVNGATRYYGQLGSRSVDYAHLSPKLGVTWTVFDGASLHASYAHGFRVPSESQLFRAGNGTTVTEAETKALLALDLKPIRADQVEVGARFARSGYSVELVVYDLVKRDDLVSQRDLATNVTTAVNAGKTDHRGIELGVGVPLPGLLRLDAALSYARHEYADWTTATASFSGKEMESAPRTLGSARLTWTPLRSTMGQLEWTHIGSYWLEASNSPTFGKYSGHDLLNLRASYAPVGRIEIFARVTNLLDQRFAESASVSSNTPVFSPGLPRAFFAGVEGKI
jgi:iron complex outermembrane receptor protein